MSLHDQLKQVTKTKEEVYAKEYREGYKDSYDGCKFVVENKKRVFETCRKVWNKGRYDGFIKRMTEFAEEDGVSFCIEYNFLQGTYYEFHRDNKLCFPCNRVDYDPFGFHIRCWVEY